MKKNTINFWLDTSLLLVMLALALSGLVIYFILPPGSGGHGGGSRLSLWGMTRHDMGDIHVYLALILIALLIAHLWLHWRWVYGTVKNILRTPKEGTGPGASRAGLLIIVTLLTLIFVTVGGFFWARTQVTASNTRAVVNNVEGEKTHEHDGITGQSTLSDICKKFEIPMEQLLQEMNLPPTVNADQRLGRLRREYGFQIDEVREAIKSWSQKTGLETR
jgi:hypothetical protein